MSDETPRAKPFTTLTVVLLGVLAVGHVLRLLGGWEIAVDGRTVPMAFSALAAAVSAVLSVMVWVEFDHLELALASSGYFKVGEMRPANVRAIRNLFMRAALTAREVRTLHGIVTALVGRRKDQL